MHVFLVLTFVVLGFNDTYNVGQSVPLPKRIMEKWTIYCNKGLPRGYNKAWTFHLPNYPDKWLWLQD